MRLRRWNFVLLAFLPVLLLALMTSHSMACEGCVNFDAISTGQNVKMVQAGFSWSVLFLMAMPFILTGWLIRVMIKACQKADERVAQAVRIKRD